MSLMKTFLGTAAALVAGVTTLCAEPALIYDVGGKFDGSFNEAAFNGAEKWAKETGGKYLEIVLDQETQRKQALRQFAEIGANPIVTTGFAMSDPIAEIAPDYPETTFVTIDGYAPLDNVLSIGFAEHQGSYLVGMLAAMASKSGTVGFIGGMDVPLIRKFACGYAEGVKAVNPDAKVIFNPIGNDSNAWRDPGTGGELAKAQISQGADVIFAAAGSSGFGVLQAAADEGILSVGVDSNQNHLHPGQVLTSMLKRVDVAVYDAMSQGEELTGGVMTLDLSEDGVGYAMDDNNADLISDDMVSSVEDARAKIIAGDIVVTDYQVEEKRLADEGADTAGACPVLTF